MLHEKKATACERVETDTSDYRTQDLDLAAFLACRNHKLFRITSPSLEEEPKYAAFEFAYSPALAADVTVWTSNQALQVPLRDFLRRRRELYREARATLQGGGR